ncbi:MAG: hypothetical protein ACLUOI_17345 [Eisenbergiella sp.]
MQGIADFSRTRFSYPTGSSNDLARDAGISRNPWKPGTYSPPPANGWMWVSSL